MFTRKSKEIATIKGSTLVDKSAKLEQPTPTIHVKDGVHSEPRDIVKVVRRGRPRKPKYTPAAKIQIDSAVIDGEKSSLDFSVPKIVLLLGKPNRGKSHALKHLLLSELLTKDGFKLGMVFTGSKFNGDYDWFDDNLIVNGWNDSMFDMWIEKMREIRESRGVALKNFLVFDDMVSLIPFNDPRWNNFICDHRHYGTTVFVSCQYLTRGTSTTFRECINYALLFNTKSRKTLQLLYELFGQLFATFDEFKEHAFAVTAEPYTAMLYDQDCDEVEYNYVSYKAPEKLPDVRVKFDT